jgi:hypothetical protein
LEIKSSFSIKVALLINFGSEIIDHRLLKRVVLAVMGAGKFIALAT